MRALSPKLLFFSCVLLGVAAAALCVALYMIAMTYSSVYGNVGKVPKEQVALVLGASISTGGVLSPVLQERADTAVELYKSRKVSKILVTGDNSSLQHDEVYPVGKYLESRGVPQQDIFLDYAGFDTYSSMYRARDVFGVTSMVVVSQRFHLPRALFIAHALGMRAVGVDASGQGERYLVNALREIPASVKAAYDLLVGRVPKFLGPQYFVGGDGSVTWVGPKAEMLYFSDGQR